MIVAAAWEVAAVFLVVLLVILWTYPGSWIRKWVRGELRVLRWRWAELRAKRADRVMWREKRKLQILQARLAAVRAALHPTSSPGWQVCRRGAPEERRSTPRASGPRAPDRAGRRAYDPNRRDPTHE